MPVTVPMPQGFDIGPALSAHAAGLQQRTQLEDRDRERESQAQAAIIRAAELADTAPGLQGKVAVSVYQYEGKDRNDCDEFFKVEDGPEHAVFTGGQGSGQAPARPARVAGGRRGGAPTTAPPY